MNEKIRKDIESTLTGLIADLKPAPAEPVESKLTESVYFDYSEKDNTRFLIIFQKILYHKLQITTREGANRLHLGTLSRTVQQKKRTNEVCLHPFSFSVQ